MSCCRSSADPRVGATMGGVAIARVVEQLAGIIGRPLGEQGFGYMMWFELDTGDPVARGGLSRTMFDGKPELEVGWTTAPDRWGEGFASELGQACVDVAFGPIGSPDLVAFTLPHNGASRRVMEKLGFAYEKTAPYKTFGDHVLYRLMNTSIRPRGIRPGGSCSTRRAPWP